MKAAPRPVGSVAGAYPFVDGVIGVLILPALEVSIVGVGVEGQVQHCATVAGIDQGMQRRAACQSLHELLVQFGVKDISNLITVHGANCLVEPAGLDACWVLSEASMACNTGVGRLCCMVSLRAHHSPSSSGPAK